MGNKRTINKAVTSKDVAKLAGVSQSTVSRVFKPTPAYKVNAEAAEKVKVAARELGYTPNLLASGMISGKTNTIALVVGDSLGPFYNKIINRFIEEIQEIGKQCLVFKVPRHEQIDVIIERAIQFQVEAVIVTASAMTKVMAETIMYNEIPVVLFNRFIPGVDINTVYSDPIKGAVLVAEHLHAKGHTNIGYVKFTKETSEENEKQIGFYSRLRDLGIFKVKEEASGYTYSDGYEAGIRMFSGENPPTAVFCTSDVIAIGLIDAVRNHYKLRIPEDVAVVGYDDIDMASWEGYNLTTVKQDSDKLITEAIQLLNNNLEGVDKNHHIRMFVPELVKRGTS